jgi:hypothetical protein
MIRVTCPKCEEDLEYRDEKAGQEVSCKVCGRKIEVPDPGKKTGSRSGSTEKKSKSITAICPACEETYPARRDELGDYVLCPNCDRRIKVREEGDEPETPPQKEKRPRRPRLKRQKSSGFSARTIFNFQVLLLLLALGCLSVIVASFRWHLLIDVGWILVSLLWGSGLLWMTIIAFQEETIEGWKFLFFPGYWIYFFLTRFSECWRGLALCLLAVLVAVGCFLSTAHMNQELKKEGKSSLPAFMASASRVTRA